MDRKLPVASLLSLTIAALLGGCGGSDSADKTPTDPVTPTTKNLEVRAVDGYLKDAQVWLDINGDYAFTAGEPNATTDGTGKATLVVTNVPDPAQYRVLVQAIANKTTDVGDGTGGTSKLVAKTFTMAAPAGVSTVTPLTTLVAQQMAANTGMTQEQAAQEVATQLGLGADKATDLLEDFIAEKNSTGQVYALNIVAALPEELDDDTADDLLTQGAAIGKALDDYLAQNPLDDDTQPDDIKVVIGDDGIVKDVIKDSDGDQIADDRDAFPNDPKEWLDSDGDKVGDNSDAFPTDAKEWKDSDGDKVGDNSDAFPSDAKEWKDSDGDKVGDNSDAFPNDPKEWLDSDGDKVGDNSDAFPSDAKEWKDSDSDKVGDNSDAFPTDAKEWKDSDSDKVGDNSDAFPSDATRAQADVVTNIEAVEVYMEDHTKRALDVKRIAKETVSYYLDGKTMTVEEGANYYWDKAKNDYVYLNGAKLIYNEYKSTTTENPDNTFLRTIWWHKDVNKDGQFQFAGQTVEQGQKSDSKESYWIFFDEDAALTETGVNDNPNNHYDGVDLAATVAAKDYSKVDMAHYVTVTKNDSTRVRHFVQRMAPKQSASDVVPSDWLDIELGTPAADYAETDTYQTLTDGGTVHIDESDWAADGTINRTESIESHPDGTSITKSFGPVWANPRDTQFEEYADYNWQNSERGSYWLDRIVTVHTVDGKAVTRDEGQRYILDQSNNANVKLVTDEQPDGLKFNDYVSISTTVSATETNEFASWTNYHLDGFPFTISTTQPGQNYKVFLKENNGFWVGHRFAEWGSQDVVDLVAKVEALRKQGIELEDIDESLLPGLSNYDGYLLTSSFRYQEDGQPRTWFWVTNVPAMTGDATSQTWKKVKLQLVNDGLAEAGYPNWIINDAGGALFLLQPKSDSPWDWYTAYDFYTLTSWKQAGHTIDTVQGKFDTGYGSFFLNEADAELALSEHNSVVDSDGDGVADTNDAFPNDASEWSDTDGDGVGDNSDAFPNDPSKWQGDSGFASTYPTMNLRGTINGWGVTPMALVADHLWSITVTLTATDAFKFDVDGTWVTDFGDNDGDGSSEFKGGDIIPAVSGSYVVQFNDLTSSYTVQPVSGEDAAVAFADFITGGQLSYSLYQEGEALGITQLDGSSYQTFELDYAVAPLAIQTVADNGSITITRDGSNTVTFTTSNGSSSSVGTEVRELNGSLVTALLMPVTQQTNVAAMQAVFGSATFGSGAKAYITTHTDEGGQSIGIVLNNIAYQNLLAVIGNPS
jgi:hypothetical protein